MLQPSVERRALLFVMKYNIMGFDQREAMKLRRTDVVDGKKQEVAIDLIDLGILSIIADMSNRTSIKKVMLEDGQYSWISYNSILEDLPIINIEKKQLSRRIAKLQSFDLVKCVVERQKGIGTFTYIRVGKKYEDITYSPHRQEIDTGSQKCPPRTQKRVAKDYITIQDDNTMLEKEKNAYARENSVAAEASPAYVRQHAHANDGRTNNTGRQPNVPEYLAEQWQRWYNHVQTTSRPYTNVESMQLCIDELDQHCAGDCGKAEKIISNAIKRRYDQLVMPSSKQEEHESENPIDAHEPYRTKDGELVIDGVIYR